MSSFSKVEVPESRESRDMETKLAESDLGRDAEKTPRDVKIGVHLRLGGAGIQFDYENKKHESSDVKTSI